MIRTYKSINHWISEPIIQLLWCTNKVPLGKIEFWHKTYHKRLQYPDKTYNNRLQCLDKTDNNRLQCRDKTYNNRLQCRDKTYNNRYQCPDKTYNNRHQCPDKTYNNRLQCPDKTYNNRLQCPDCKFSNNRLQRLDKITFASYILFIFFKFILCIQNLISRNIEFQIIFKNCLVHSFSYLLFICY